MSQLNRTLTLKISVKHNFATHANLMLYVHNVRHVKQNLLDCDTEQYFDEFQTLCKLLGLTASSLNTVERRGGSADHLLRCVTASALCRATRNMPFDIATTGENSRRGYSL